MDNIIFVNIISRATVRGKIQRK